MNSTEKKLKAILFRHFCPTEMELGEFKLGVLADQRQDAIGSHIEFCPHCQRALIQISEAIDLPLVQEEQMDGLLEETPTLSEKVKIYIVNLLSPPPGILMDSAPQLAFRGQGDAMGTQVFQFDSYLVAISFERDLSHLRKFNLVGDVSAVEEMESAVTYHFWKAYLWQEEVLVESVPLDEEGNFIFLGIEQNDKPFELILSSPVVEIHLQHLQITGGTGDDD